MVILGNVAFNALLDVYGILPTPGVRGINLKKFGLDRHARIGKAYAVRQQHPEVIILGSSRAESAFDPRHSYFAGTRVYNLAFPGAAVYEELRYLQHATGSGKLKQAVVAVDFFQFLHKSQKLAPDFREDRLTFDALGNPQSYPWSDVVSLFASGSAFKESWRSLKKQSKQISIYRDDGYRDDSDDIPSMLRQRNGQKYEFLVSEKGYVRVYRGGASALTNYSVINRSPYTDIEVMRRLSDKEQFALIVLVPPVHVRHLALIDLLDLWPAFEDWKKTLVRLLSEGRDDDVCALWDFAQVTPMTIESIPADGSGVSMRWWRESSHATSTAGAEVMNAIGAGVTSEIGQCLSRSNMGVALAQQRNALSEWEQANALEMNELREMLANVR